MSLSYQSKQSKQSFSRPRYVKKHKCSHFYDYGYCKFGTDCWEHPDYVPPSKPKQNCVHTDPISKGGWGKKFCSLGENCRSAQARKNPDMTINGKTKSNNAKLKYVLCKNLTDHGECLKKDTICPFAHSEEERKANMVQKACREFIFCGACSLLKDGVSWCKYQHPEDREKIFGDLQKQKCSKVVDGVNTCDIKHCCYNHDPNFVPVPKEEGDKVFIVETNQYVQKEKFEIVLDSDDEEEEDEELASISSESEEEAVRDLETPQGDEDEIEAIRKRMQELELQKVNIDVTVIPDQSFESTSRPLKK